MQDLESEIRVGLAWSGIAQAGSQLISLVVTVILMHLLSPQDFGLAAMVVVFTGFAMLFTDMGFGAALIQKVDVEQRHKNAVFWVSIAVGVLLTLIFAAAAPYIASFYGVPELQSLTIAISPIFIINSFGTITQSLVQKAMDFRTLAIAGLTSSVIPGAAAIYLALSGFGVWSIVALYVLNAIVYVAMVWVLAPWRPDFSLQLSAVKDLSKFGTNYLGAAISNYWTLNCDNLLIGRYLGSAPLGIYSRSYAILVLPLTQIASVITFVMFPALSKIQNDIERVRALYLRSISVISLVAFPVSLGLLVLSRPLVLTLFGDTWAGMIPIIQVFSILSAIQSIGITGSWLYQSQGRTDIMFRWGLVVGSIYIISFVVGLRWGALGVAVAYTVANFLLWHPNWSIPARLIDLNFATMLRKLAPQFYAAATMALAVWAFGLLLPNSWSYAAHLTLQVSFGAAFYFIFVRSFRLEAYAAASSVIQSYLRQLRAY
ncbi:MAG: MOP flippase family protein [Halobacteriota archaeon]